MKITINKTWSSCICGIALLGLTSCNDFLDREPLSAVSPDKFFMSESDLASYSITLYSFRTPEGWTMMSGEDNNTDNQAAVSPGNRFSPGNYRVDKNGGNWEFKTIYNCNYFLDAVLERQKLNLIQGNTENINHYIGEVYFLRAYNYFLKLKEYGDFPIIKTTLPDEEPALIEASKRMPRNEVARFILSDLDNAINLLKQVSPNQKNRISKDVAYLFKSRVALFEASWLTNFKGTPFVPQGSNWPGATKEYNASYHFPTGSIEKEIEFFLEQAIESSAVVADKIQLTTNTKNETELTKEIQNPYFKMFSDENLEGYPEVLFWRDYDAVLSSHVTTRYLYYGSNGSGYTKGFVESFLMENGLPIYASTDYKGDRDFDSFRQKRDWRLRLFCKIKGDYLYSDNGDNFFAHPMIISSSDERDVTGYSLRKYCNFKFYPGAFVDTGWPIFRAAEAYLNYMEAYYMRHNSLNEKAKKYWIEIRNRAGVDTDFEKTIAATDIAKEAKGDWAAYTAGKLLTDATMYNIRRERRCEFIGEGFRYDDLRRWRAIDQLITTPYIIEGFNLWDSNFKEYVNADGETTLIVGGTRANVSPKTQSTYLRPYQIVEENNRFYNGYKWHAAHYLAPIAMDNFIQTATPGNKEDLTTSPIYQNPGWPTTAQQGPGAVNGF